MLYGWTVELSTTEIEMVELKREYISFDVVFTDTLGVLARTLGQEHFLPLAEESLQLGLKLMKEMDDPDLRRCT